MSLSATALAPSHERPWGAVCSMAMCVALLIAAEFMPVSLLTPIATDLNATNGMAGQAISISGLFAVLTSLLIPGIASRFDRRIVLVGLTLVMLASLVLIAAAPNFTVLMAARALLGVTVGGFWALATATVMRLVPYDSVPRALGIVYMGNAVATAFAAPIGSYLGGLIGWRGVFWILVPLVLANLAWQWLSLPKMAPQAASPVKRVFGLLRRIEVAVAMVAVMLTFAGAFATFTYLRPFLETITQVTLAQLSLMLLGLGSAAFAGTYIASILARKHLPSLLKGLPLALAATTVAMLLLGDSIIATGMTMVVWGGLNAAIPVAWSTWLSREVRDEPDSGGGLMVAAIQLAIMLGAAFGGLLLDHIAIQATFIGGATLLVLASVTAHFGSRLERSAPANASVAERAAGAGKDSGPRGAHRGGTK
ncbi:MAG: putative transporter [Paucimonas sp.]|nr:putative transporter [Paucimonas sp.]